MHSPIIIPCATENAWHAERAKMLGASEIAALVGQNPYMTPLQLWSKKKLDRASTLEDTEALLAGKFLEDGNARWYAHAHGVHVVTPQEFYGLRDAAQVVVRHPQFPIQCTPDRFIVRPAAGESEAEVRVLQLKNVSAFLLDRWVEAGEVVPPLSVQIQVQIEMFCTGIERGAIGAIIGGNSRKDAPDIELNRQFVERLAALAVQFWRSLDGDVPPAALAADVDFIGDQFPKSVAGLSKELEHPELLVDLANIKAELKALEEHAGALEARLKSEIGPAEVFTINGKKAGTWKTQVRNDPPREARTSEFRVFRLDSSITKQAKALSHDRPAILPQ